MRQLPDVPMRLCSFAAGCLLYAVTASAAFSQTLQIPPNPQPVQSAAAAPQANLLYTSFRTSAQFGSVAQNASQPRGTESVPIANGEAICGFKHIGTCLKDLRQDEIGVFTSPLRVQPRTAYWLAPLGAATGLAIAYDADAAATLGHDRDRIDTAGNISAAGEFWATGGESAGIYFLGLYRKDTKLAETGRLAAESILVSGSVTGLLKLATNRERPNQGDGRGDFWTNPPSGYTLDSSFPSGHATASMALARVIAGEYPHWYVMVPAFGFAETVSIGRVLALDHFPSDVIVGQAIGFLSANYVLDHHALYMPGSRKTLAGRLLGSVNPLMDARTRTIGASLNIPFGR